MEGELRAKAAQEKLSAKLAEKRKVKLQAIQAEGKQHKKHACKHCDGTFYKNRIGAHMINNHAEELQRRLAPYKDRIAMPTVPIKMLGNTYICLCCQDVWDLEARALSHIAKSGGACSPENQIRKLYEFLQCPAPRGAEQKVHVVADKIKQMAEVKDTRSENEILYAQNLELRNELRRTKHQLTNKLEYTAYKYQTENKILKERLAISQTFLESVDKKGLVMKGDLMPIYNRAVDAVCLDEEEMCRLEDLKSRCADLPAEVVPAPAANTIELPAPAPPAPAPTVTEPESEPTPAPELIVCKPAAEPQPTPEPPAQPTQKRIKPKVPRRDKCGEISQPAAAPEKPAPTPAEKPATPPTTPPAHDKCALCRVATGYGDDTLIACGGCGQNTHAQNDLVGCYQMDCETCHKSICLICVKKAGGNKLHPYCSRACNTRLDN